MTSRCPFSHLIGTLLLIFLFSSRASGDCTGCCSGHGGVTCQNGVTQCADGSSLSSKCVSKGCNKCGYSRSQDKPNVKSVVPSKTQAETKTNKIDKNGFNKIESIKDSLYIQNLKYKITTTSGKEVIVDSYWEEGGQIKFKQHDGTIGFPKNMIKKIELMP